MKKSLLILIAVVFVAAISSCKKETIVNNPNTNTTVIRTIAANSWVLDQAEGAYRVDLSVPQLDDIYNDEGAVLVYVSYGTTGNNQAPVYEQIPQVYQGIAFSYYHTDGKVVIYSQTPGGNPGTPPSQALTVKIVLIDSVPE